MAGLLLLCGNVHAGELRGRILVASAPAAGVTIAAVPYEAPGEEARRQARRGEAPRPITTATTHPDGTFSLAVPPTSAAFRLEAHGGGVAPSWLGGTYEAAETDDLGDLALPRSQPLSGRVVNGSGAPVAGAEVTVAPGSARLEADSDVTPALRTATTGPDGAFRVDEASAAINAVTIEAKGYGAARFPGVRGGAMPKPAVLGSAASLSGTVRRSDHKTPAAGALVRFEAEGLATRWIESGPDGAFRLADLPPRAGRVVADAGEAGRAESPAGGPPGSPARPLVLVTSLPSKLAGSVVDVTTRGPVPRARIALDDGARTLLARAGPDGRYEVRGLAPQRAYRLKVDDPRYAPFERGGILLTTGQTRRLDVPLRRSASLSGRVVDEAGQPVSGAVGRLAPAGENGFAVRLRGARGGRVVFRTGTDGGFSATRLVPGDDQRLTVFHPDFAAHVVGGLSLPPGGGKSGLTVVLHRGLGASGIVKDEAGRPVPDAVVEMFPTLGFGIRGGIGFGGPLGGGGRGPGGAAGRGPAGDGGNDRPKATTRSDGRFDVKGLAEGDYVLSVSKDGYAEQSVDPVRVRSDPPASVDITLGPGASIRGVVVRADGSAAEGYDVRAVEPGSRRIGPFGGTEPVTTGADGSFSIEGLRAGETYDLVVSTRGRLGPRKGDVGAPSDGVEIVLPSPGRIAGRVIDAQTLSPIPEFQVNYEPDRSSGGFGFGGGPGGGGRGGLLAALLGRNDRLAVHSDDGGFAFEDVPAGTWEVVAQAPGYQSARVGGLTLEEGGRREGVDVRLRRGNSIQGQVLDLNSGQPILDVAVTLRRPGGPGGLATPGEADARTDADGRYSVDGVGPGSYTVMARHPDYADGSTVAEVKDGPVTADIRLTPGGTVGGTVLAESSTPLPGASVTLGTGGGGFGRGGGIFAGGQASVTDEAGRFRFTHVTAGRYVVAASLQTRQAPPVELVLQAGEARENLVLSLAAGARIHGLVTGLPASLRASVTVTANGPNGYFATARAAADGSFELSGAPAGPINLRAIAGDPASSMRSASAQVDVADGQTAVESEIVFPTGFTLSGTVTRSGQAVTGAMVSAALQGAGGRSASAQTGDGGSYRLEGLTEGTYSVMAAAPGGRPQRETAAVSDDVTLDFVLPAARLAGVVVESGSQQPVPDAAIQVTAKDAGAPPGRGATTDSNGRFDIEGLAPEPYVLSARKAGYQLSSKEVTPAEGGGEDVVLELVRGEGIGIEVRDAQLGVPVRGVQARALDAQGAVAFAGGVALDADGRGEIPSLPPGSYTLALYSAGYAPAIVAASAPAPRVVVAMPPSGTVEVHAGPQTLAAGTARGQILTESGQPYPFAFFAADGRFNLSAPIRRLDGFAAGRYLVQMESGASKPFEIQAGAVTVVVLP